MTELPEAAIVRWLRGSLARLDPPRVTPAEQACIAVRRRIRTVGRRRQRVRVLAAGAATAVVVSVAVQFPHLGGSPMGTLPLQGPPLAQPLLGVFYHKHVGRLVEVDPETLRRSGSASAPAAADAQYSYSPDGTRLAIVRGSQGNMSGLTIVDARDLHVIRTISTGVDLPLFQIDWTTTGIVEVAGPCGPCGRATVVRINPVTGATTRAPLHGSFQQSTPTVDALYVVVGPVSGIGPSKIARLDGQRSRVFPLSRIRSGLDPRSTHPRHQWTPALAVDPTTDTCYVLAAGSPVAQADFGTGRVTYHALSERHSLADLLASWLIPPAAGKEDIYGASWTAQWLGDGYLALAGRTTTPDSTTPTGLRIVDVRHWSQTTLDRSADRFLVADGALIAIRDPVDGSGVDVGAPAFGYDDHGRRIFTVGDLAHRVYRIDVVGDLAFVFFYCTFFCSYSVVDTETGDILGPKRGSTRLIEPLVGRTSQGY